jgi:hypothetical protein
LDIELGLPAREMELRETKGTDGNRCGGQGTAELFIEGVPGPEKKRHAALQSSPYLGIGDELRLACHFFQNHLSHEKRISASLAL